MSTPTVPSPINEARLSTVDRPGNVNNGLITGLNTGPSNLINHIPLIMVKIKPQIKYSD